MTKKIDRHVKLSDAQLAVLTAASRRKDRRIVGGEKTGPATKAVAALQRLGLVAAGPKGFAITAAGLSAIGVEAAPGKATGPIGGAARATARSAPDAVAPGLPDAARPGTKKALIIALLRRKHGATLDDLIAATGWLPHTARAALTGLRHKGYVLDRSKNQDGRAIYRVAAPAAAARVG